MKAELFHSYGFINIKGNYYIGIGHYYERNTTFGSFNELDPAQNYEKKQANQISLYPSDPLKHKNGVRYVNQLIHYFPDSNKLLFARVIDEGKMSLLQISGMKL